MGRVLSDHAEQDGAFEVVAGIDPNDSGDSAPGYPVYTSAADVVESADVVVDFSSPAGIPALVDEAVSRRWGMVVATTGLDPGHLEQLQRGAERVPILRAANMSLGINLLKLLVKQTATVLGQSFDVEIIERHHRMKQDAPSGTALVLAEALRDSIDAPRTIVHGREGKEQRRTDSQIGVHAVRGGTIVGEHDVVFAGNNELIELSHKAYSRSLFAVGALKAAEYVRSKKPGLYGMDDLVAESTAVTRLYTGDEALISIPSLPAKPAIAFDLFQAFADEGISLDMISQTSVGKNSISLSFTLRESDADIADTLLQRLSDKEEIDGATLTRGLTKIVVEGIGMELQSGVAASVFAVLADLGVEPLAVSTSETKIGCVINDTDATSVINAIRSRFDV